MAGEGRFQIKGGGCVSCEKLVDRWLKERCRRIVVHAKRGKIVIVLDDDDLQLEW